MKAPWQIKDIIDQIIELSSRGNFICVHTYREGNVVAHHLANFGEMIRDQVIFEEAISLPKEVKASVRLDRANIPNFRIRLRKNHFVLMMLTLDSIGSCIILLNVNVTSFCEANSTQNVMEETFQVSHAFCYHLYIRMIVIILQHVLEAKVYVLLCVILIFDYIHVGVLPKPPTDGGLN